LPSTTTHRRRLLIMPRSRCSSTSHGWCLTKMQQCLRARLLQNPYGSMCPEGSYRSDRGLGSTLGILVAQSP
jgi:hypothetical protein